jgi:DNA-binding NarL/FixJ family response regulator
MSKIYSQAIVADSHFLTSAGIAEVLQNHVGIADVRCANSFADLCALLARNNHCQILTIDLAFAGMDGLAGVRLLRAHYPNMRIVVISDNASKEAVLESLSAGVHGYIVTDMTADRMVEAFKDILLDKIFVPLRMAEISDAAKSDKPAVVPPNSGAAAMVLTSRQCDVLSLIRKGLSNKQIAYALGISGSTVKVHIAAAFRQLGVHNRVGAIIAFEKLSNKAKIAEKADNVSYSLVKRRASDFTAPAAFR